MEGLVEGINSIEGNESVKGLLKGRLGKGALLYVGFSEGQLAEDSVSRDAL